MTVQAQTKSITYAGNGVTTTFAYPFRIIYNEDLRILFTDSDGNITQKNLITDYTVTGINNVNGGNVIFTVAPPVGTSIYIARLNQLYLQMMTFLPNSKFDLSSLENTLDRFALQDQQLDLKIGQAISIPFGELVSRRRFKIPYFDINGNLSYTLNTPNTFLGFNESGQITYESALPSLPEGYFIQSGVGAVQRTYQNKVRETLSVKDFGALGDGITDDYLSFIRTIAAARLQNKAVFIPNGNYVISSTLRLGSTTEAFVSLVGEENIPTINYTGSGFALDCSGLTNQYVECKIVENINIINLSNTLNDGGINCQYTGQLVLRKVQIQTLGVGINCNETISMNCYDCFITGTNTRGKYGIRGGKRNFNWFGGRIYSMDVCVQAAGDAHIFSGLNCEFSNVIIQTQALSTALFEGCHFETSTCLLTNAVTIPFNDAGDWVDNGSEGIGISDITFNNCHMALNGGMNSGATNFIVIKSQGGFSYSLTINGGFVLAPNLKVRGSFTPNASDSVPSGTVIKLLGRNPGTILDVMIPTDSFSQFIKEMNQTTSYSQISPVYFANRPIATLGIQGSDASEVMGPNSAGFGLQGYTTTLMYSTFYNRSVVYDGNSFRPSVDGGIALGTPSLRWGQIYSTSGSISTSDRNQKTDIQQSDLGLDFIEKLNPVKYRFKDRVRPHYGLISQEVEDVINVLGIDFAGFIKSKKQVYVVNENYNPEIPESQENLKGYFEDTEEDVYALRYEEFIGILIKAVQELNQKIKNLEGE